MTDTQLKPGDLIVIEQRSGCRTVEQTARITAVNGTRITWTNTSRKPGVLSGGTFDAADATGRGTRYVRTILRGAPAADVADLDAHRLARGSVR